MSRDFLIPTYTFPSPPQNSSADRGTLDSVRQRDLQIMCCGDGESIPILLGGPRRLGVKVAARCYIGSDIVLLGVVCEGPISAIRSVKFGDDDPPAGTKLNVYLGHADQPVDTMLRDAFAAQKPSVVYKDTLPNVAYIVLRTNVSGWTSFPNITVEADGLLIYNEHDTGQLPNDPATWKFSRNPSRILAHIFRYYTPHSVDSDHLLIAANANDELVNGIEPRRTMSLALDRPQEVVRWIDVIRSYAACWCAPQGGEVCLVPDRPSPSVYEFTDEHGKANIADKSFNWYLTSADDLSTVVQVNVTDVTKNPPTTLYPRAVSPGVLNGTLERRETVLSMEGVTSYSQGYREAVEQLNHSLLEMFSATWEAFDVAIKLRVGNVITLSVDGICHKMLMRINALVSKSAGRYTISAKKYDPACYSDAIAQAPSGIDPLLPDPSNPPAPTGLVLEEELFALQDKTLKSRIRVTWQPVEDLPYRKSYYVEVWSGSKLMWSADTELATYATPVVEEGVHYIVRVATRTSVYASEYISGDIVALGKEMPPPDVERLTIQQVANWVLFSWPRVVDVDAIKRYQIRRWPAAGAWETGITIDEPDMLAYRSNSEPLGTWYYGIVAIDQGERTSKNPTVVQFRVAPDNAAYFVDENQFAFANLESMLVWETRDGVTHYSTSHGDKWGDLFPLAMEHYPLPIDAYHSGGESSLATEWWDVGVVVDGQFTVLAALDNDDGVAHVWLETSTDMVSIDVHDGGSARTRARFCRARFTTDGAMTVHGLPKVVITATPNVESFFGMSSATAPTIVTLEGHYFALKDCIVNPQGEAALLGIAANFQLSETAHNTFEVRVFNSATNQQVAVPFTGTFNGISF
ncbi:MAG: hypothetical protein LBE32_05625 [Burkholderiales bacterium]|nr:hypothetical protein [Burkholderiales bacterium]